MSLLGPEKRVLKRHPFIIDCRLDWGSRTLPGKIVNLTFVGAMIELAGTSPPVHSEISIRLSVPEGETTLHGVVIHNSAYPSGSRTSFLDRNHCCIGIEFIEHAVEGSAKLTPIFRYHLA